MRRKNLFSVRGGLIVGIILFLLIGLNHHHSAEPADTSSGNKTYPVDQADSLWAVVDKGRVLPAAYAPSSLRAPGMPLRLNGGDPEMYMRGDAAAAMEKLNQGAIKSGIHLMFASGYRSYKVQAGLYNFYVSSQGQAQADDYSARPGHSEHQTGLAADLEPYNRQCELDPCFASTDEGKWLAANAYKYGFIIRYGQNQQSLTGYNYEPWHIRYVGNQLAQQLQSTHQTLEQYFRLPTYSSYPQNIFQLK